MIGATVFGASRAEAFGFHSSGGWGGSSGGSWGGSSGGSWGKAYYGSWGSSGGWRYYKRLRRSVRRAVRYQSSGGSYGSWGSWGGSSGGSWGRHYHGSWGGSSGGYVGWGGSSGGSRGYVYNYGGSHGGSHGGWTVVEPDGTTGPVPADSYRVDDEAPPPVPGNEALDGSGENGDGLNFDSPAPDPNNPLGGNIRFRRPASRSDLEPNTALLDVRVPRGTQVFVNGRPTQSGGQNRQFVSRGLQSGFVYKYEIRAVMQHDGETLEDTKVVRLQGGERANVEFDFSNTASPDNVAANEPVNTRLTLEVPEDARVFLAGQATKTTGTERTYDSGVLNSGEAWPGYTVRVEWNHEGRTQVQERTVTLEGGQDHHLAFDFANGSLDAEVAQLDR